MTPAKGLTGALAAMLPGPTPTSFLRCCLADGDALEPAWRDWAAHVPDTVAWLQHEGQALRGHLPRFHQRLVEGAVLVPGDLLPYLKVATVRERRRSETWVRGASDGLAALGSADVDVTVLAGAAVSAVVGEDHYLRHCHDLDLWIRDVEVSRAVDALVGADHTVVSSRPDTTLLQHPSGLPVALHAALLPGDGPGLSEAELRARRTEVCLFEQPTHLLSAPDLFVHVTALATTHARRPHANWVVDAHRIGSVMGERDWRTVADIVEGARLALPLLVLFGYLYDELALPIPSWLMDALDAGAAVAAPDDQRRALEGARHGVPGGLRSMLATGGLRSVPTIVRRLLLPAR